MTIQKHKQLDKVQTPEIVTFMMYASLGIVALFVVMEVALLGYWLTVESTEGQFLETKTDLTSANSRLELEVSYRRELREVMRMYENSDEMSLAFHQQLRSRLAGMTVPPSYRYYHLSLVVLLDEIIDAELIGQTNYNYTEKERQLSLLMHKYQ